MSRYGKKESMSCEDAGKSFGREEALSFECGADLGHTWGTGGRTRHSPDWALRSSGLGVQIETES